MWECGNCKEKLEDKYRHCWNCGKSKPEVGQELSSVKIHRLADEPPSEAESAPQEKLPPEIVPPPESQVLPKVEFSLAESAPQNKLPPPEDDILSKKEFSVEVRPPSKILKLIPLLLWFAAVIFVAGFTYYSYQKMNAFENRILEDARNFNNQKDQLVFSKNAPRGKISLQPKVLPLNAKNSEVDDLYRYLPDELRPANLDEVKTIMWLDCKSNEFGRYEDNSIAYQEKCNAYLVDKNTAKVIEVQDFLGETPPLTKKRGNSDAYGKVLTEAYISFIKANQSESARTADRFSSDSPNHHFISKSELLCSIILLGLLGAVGLGWLVFKIKSANWDSK